MQQQQQKYRRKCKHMELVADTVINETVGIFTRSGLDSLPGESRILSTGTTSAFFSNLGGSLWCPASSGWGG